MKRTPLTRRSPLKRKTWADMTDEERANLPPRSELPPVNRKRRAANFARSYGEHAEFIRQQPCCIGHPLCRMYRVEAAHTESGGIGRKAHRRTLVPLCSLHHASLHNAGVLTFERVCNVDLKALAAQYWENSPHGESCEP